MLHDGCGREKRAREIISGGIESSSEAGWRLEPDGRFALKCGDKESVWRSFGPPSAELWEPFLQFLPNLFAVPNHPSAHYSTHLLEVQRTEF